MWVWINRHCISNVHPKHVLWSATELMVLRKRWAPKVLKIFCFFMKVQLHCAFYGDFPGTLNLCQCYMGSTSCESFQICRTSSVHPGSSSSVISAKYSTVRPALLSMKIRTLKHLLYPVWYLELQFILPHASDATGVTELGTVPLWAHLPRMLCLRPSLSGTKSSSCPASFKNPRTGLSSALLLSQEGGFGA